MTVTRRETRANRRMRRRIRKFADKEHTHNQTDSSNTEATLILCGSLGERANIQGYDNMVILSLKCLNKIAFSLFEKVNDALTVSVNIGGQDRSGQVGHRYWSSVQMEEGQGTMYCLLGWSQGR